MQNDGWLMEGDCLEKMKEIPDGSVDMILADLPYGTTTCKWDIVIPFELLWEQYWRIIKQNGAILLFGSEPFSSYLRISQIKFFKYDWVWEKDKGTGIGNVNKQPLRKHETISVFYTLQPYYDKTGELLERPYKHKLPTKNSETGSINGISNNLNKDGSYRYVEYTHTSKHSLIYAARANSKNELCFHPTQKPVTLLEFLIKTYTQENETVLDNVMGSGSTGVACVNTGRRFIGIEKDEKYFQIARERISNAILKK